MVASVSTRWRARLLLEDLQQQSSSSSEGDVEDDDESEEEEEEVVVKSNSSNRKKSNDDDSKGTSEVEGKDKRPATITLSLKRVCKVCKESGHEAGFRGATYVDCPNKPCYLCKMPGHTTMTCPHRVAMEHGVIPAPVRNSKTPLDYVFNRQLNSKAPKVKLAFSIPNQLDSGLIRFHSRRVTCLEFHPTKNGVLLSGDKKGQLGIWDYDKLHEKKVYGSHSCIVNNIKFTAGNNTMAYTASSDGTLKWTDMETGVKSLLMDLNPDGWNGPASWRMLYGMDVNLDKGALLVGDDNGYVYLIDVRSEKRTGEPILLHKKGSKVVGLHCNPVQPELLLSCGNDHFARIWDIRMLKAESCLANLFHQRVVNSAYFSPLSGSKILTTSQDNRIRVWDSIFGNLDEPSREIVHSHDFNRHLTPFRAEWDPKDPSESLAVIGRYISENYDGLALHPIDLIDTSNGKLVAELIDTNITTISPVNKLHPREDILASGSSRSLFIWRTGEDETSPPKDQVKSKLKELIFGGPEKKSNRKFKGKHGGESDDDSDNDLKAKKQKTQKSNVKYTTKVSRKG